MKRLFLIVLCGLSLSIAAQAASFDCGKAMTKVDKLICADVELSSLDEEMAAAYEKAHSETTDNFMLQQEQRAWLKTRQWCWARNEHSACLATRYRERIRKLSENPITEQRGLCAPLAKLVRSGRAFDLIPKGYEDNPPRGNDYKNLDIDGDGISDKVATSCGTAECYLEVKLSSGNVFENNGLDSEDHKFLLIQYKSNNYALVMTSSDEESKDPNRKLYLLRLYLLTPKGAKLVCGR